MIFSAGHLVLADNLTKLTTVRMERTYYAAFEPGEVRGVFQEEKKTQIRRLQVTHVTHEKINNLPWIQLATDGWLAADEAVQDLGSYYEHVTAESQTAGITFLPKPVFEAFSGAHQTELQRLPVEEAAVHPYLRRLFLRPICQTAIYHQLPPEEYLNLLCYNRIISVAERDKVLTQKGLLALVPNSRIFQTILDTKDKKNVAYRRIVLAGIADW